MKTACTIVIPAFREDESIKGVLNRIAREVNVSFECLIVTDSEDDPTNKIVNDYHAIDNRFKVSINKYGRGPAKAIRWGIDSSSNEVVVVTMADGSDDPADIDKLVKLLDRGVVLAAASRYMPGGQQVGAPLLKSLLSRLAGISLFYLRRVGTRDATNSFKAYDKKFINKVGIESIDGFELGLELVSKAKRLRLPVAEIPTIWIEREKGVSNFKIFRWLPRYLKWYFFAFGVGSLKNSEDKI